MRIENKKLEILAAICAVAIVGACLALVAVGVSHGPKSIQSDVAMLKIQANPADYPPSLGNVNEAEKIAEFVLKEHGMKGTIKINLDEAKPL